MSNTTADNGNNDKKLSRRAFLTNSLLLPLTVLASQVIQQCTQPLPAKAVNGMVMFPLTHPLSNTYYLVRAGESVDTAVDRVHTNPVDKINMNIHGLTKAGAEQMHKIAAQLKEIKVGTGENGRDLWIWPSQSIQCLQSADIVAYDLSVPQSNVVPEFAMLDSRGLGTYEGTRLSASLRIVDEQDRADPTWKPPKATDGTLNESLQDVQVRVRQLVSKTETQYSNADVVFIAPDSFTLAVLQSSLEDKMLKSQSDLSFKPGELRVVEPVVREPAPLPVVPL